jgi:hypothetical protein
MNDLFDQSERMFRALTESNQRDVRSLPAVTDPTSFTSTSRAMTSCPSATTIGATSARRSLRSLAISTRRCSLAPSGADRSTVKSLKRARRETRVARVARVAKKDVRPRATLPETCRRRGTTSATRPELDGHPCHQPLGGEELCHELLSGDDVRAIAGDIDAGPGRGILRDVERKRGGVVVAVLVAVLGNAVTDVAALAHIDGLVLSIGEEVETGLGGDGVALMGAPGAASSLSRSGLSWAIMASNCSMPPERTTTSSPAAAVQANG